ncbi:hypothetical protein EYF80_023237 [Liparis tanakae]|uniref:Uncharacterized protein n=1 Tax=Liparis tanakae TaxID=230148 RepID=A0A4Z2HLZ9_9TELE|nr:hypothetical protein EYF80_023237 [Liparis tanakae]
MPRLNGSLRLPGALRAARIDQLGVTSRKSHIWQSQEFTTLNESGSWWPRAEDRASRLAVVPAPGCRGGCRPAGCGVSGTGMAWPWERC